MDKVIFIERQLRQLVLATDPRIVDVTYEHPIGGSEYVVILYCNGEELSCNITFKSKTEIVLSVFNKLKETKK